MLIDPLWRSQATRGCQSSARCRASAGWRQLDAAWKRTADFFPQTLDPDARL